MTREDAKHIVDVAFGVPQAVRRAGEDRTYHEDEIREAKKMAIKALDQEPTAKNDLGVTGELEKNSKKLEKNFGELDCISREQALKELKESAEHHVNDSREEVLLRRDRDIIRALPSVTPQEPKTGHWIPTYGNVKCSVCGSVKDSREVGRATHYCDFCGAKMDEPQKSEDKE